MPDRKIGIIGPGTMGSIMVAYLSRNQENIYLIDIKEELIEAVNEVGIIVTVVGNIFNTRVKGTGYFTFSLSRFEVDLIFVTVKSNFLDTLLDEIKLIFRTGQKIVPPQNGIDNEDRTAEKFSQDDSLRFVINYAVMIPCGKSCSISLDFEGSSSQALIAFSKLKRFNK